MRIKLDENLPQALVPKLTAAGHDIQSVQHEGLTGKPDADIWRATQAEGRFLVTQDLDFSDVRRFQPGTHHGILLVRLRNPSRSELAARVAYLFHQERVEDWAGCFVVATDRKVRVMRPPAS
jgi:predicted nuclease of predicted toxin-antitoxin system